MVIYEVYLLCVQVFFPRQRLGKGGVYFNRFKYPGWRNFAKLINWNYKEKRPSEERIQLK